MGEGALDYGGPRREFFRLLSHAARGAYFQGLDDCKFFMANVSAIQVVVSMLIVSF